MTLTLLAVLVVASMAILVPALLRARRSEPLTTSESFKRRLAMMAPRYARGGRWVVTPDDRTRRGRSYHQRSQARRQRALVVLAAVAALTAFPAVIARGPWWEVHFIADAALALYVAVLLEAKKRRKERVIKVHAMASRRRDESVHQEPEAGELRAVAGRHS